MDKERLTFDIAEQYEIYRDKVYACWMGKNIGGTLGVPFEGEKRLLDLTDYTNIEDAPLANDDLDLQLLWLHALEQYGAGLTAHELGKEWVDHVFFPFDEYGYCLNNLRLGLAPPLSGSHGNPFTDCMGSPIRSEIWACVCPGDPDGAAYYAHQDAIVDHAGGEGVYGEMFLAAVESAAFAIGDRNELIRIGLTYIPEQSRTAQAIRSVVQWHEEGVDWIENRERVLSQYGNENFTDAPQNIAFTLIGWLYGNDFGDALCKAVNCGYDTDCTGATLGSLWGILHGSQGLPDRWTRPIGEKIVVSPAVNGFPAPRNLQELTDRVCSMGRQVSAWLATHRDQLDVRRLWELDTRAIEYKHPFPSRRDEMIRAVVRYEEGDPGVGPAERIGVRISFHNNSTTDWGGELDWIVPDGWQPSGPVALNLKAGETTQVDAAFVSGGEWSPSYKAEGRLKRHFNGSPWSVQGFPVVFVAKRQWLVGRGGCEAERWAADNRVPWSGHLPETDGTMEAATTIDNPRDQEVRIIAATKSPIEVWLNDRKIIEGGASDCSIPAFHRPREGNYCDLRLTEGAHQLRISVPAAKDEELPEVYFMVVEQEKNLYASKLDVRIG
ncbi:ADP-ribosylglycohydrolase family protein [Paenibacillaceae bacterium WGS1546]|uniref:ADP-ribosylglycohydrolase family protein n=1 Tax=Cohnella sp. WGS1546 TaxID=3366810 RepID=UPI00372D5D00